MVLTEYVFLVSVRGYIIIRQLFSNSIVFHQPTPTVIIGLSSLKHSGFESYYLFEKKKSKEGSKFRTLSVSWTKAARDQQLDSFVVYGKLVGYKNIEKNCILVERPAKGKSKDQWSMNRGKSK